MLGFINIYKPKGMTSHDVVSCLRRVTKIRQIGHTGTLDPLAEGVLPVAIGKASRIIEFLEEDKAYVAELAFGKVSDTYDIEGEIRNFSDNKVSEDQVISALANFRGEIEQIPPAYSAVHYNGKRLYELAREGIIPEDIPKRLVTISKLEVLDFDYSKQTARIEIHCSKGTYVRSIISDLGAFLSVGAIMTGLIRTKSGKFSLEKSVHLNDLTDISDVESCLINPIEVLSYKSYQLTTQEIEKVKHGQALHVKEFSDNELICLVFENNLCAIAVKNDSLLKVKKVFI